MSDPSAGVEEPVLQLDGGTLAFGDRVLWSELDLTVRPGEFIAILGANGSGKSSLMKAILGLTPLTSGRLEIAGSPPARGSRLIGYVPQERRLAPSSPIRVRDLVGLGIDGASWGIGWPNRSRRLRIERILASVGALHLADVPVHQLSGGEQQRIRIGQALSTDPRLLLCDEPLLSLDLTHQRTVVSLIDHCRAERGTAVLFVTHEINPVLPYVDRVLYLADGQFRIGTVAEVMTSESLSALYGSPIEVVRVGGRILIAGVPDLSEDEHHHATEAPPHPVVAHRAAP
ncbi:ABC transporter ATP-binding protein [Jatrophihabitans telluris]|uniref:ABC transporter ATP-binding protein n=1 Tax=Jatrophihabitans telluris TaxID=2038343 RepID=A0ABY4R2R3_9ACTN|nr:ABC transporter ATP-binding protein [Jatrophihabitans telluris]UQX89622.1 ABC transporter ATP-binding protein [Jatrophihabitans telluris]